MKKVVILLCMLLLTGCTKSSVNIETEILNHLNSKYDGNFSVIGKEEDSGVTKIHSQESSLNSEEEHIEVYIKDGEIIGDNYFSYYIRPEVENYIGNVVGKEFEEYKVYRSNDYYNLPNELTSRNTLEDLYNKKEDYWVDVKIFVKGNPYDTESYYEDSIRRIEQELLDSRHNYTVYLFSVNDELYNLLDRYGQDAFWRFYATHREPDGYYYYYVYNATIVDGEVK